MVGAQHGAAELMTEAEKTVAEYRARAEERRDIYALRVEEDRKEERARTTALVNLLGNLDHWLDDAEYGDAERLAHIRKARGAYDAAIREICATPRSV